MPNNASKAFTRKLRRYHTPAEARRWHYLRNRRLGGLRFHRQYPLGAYVTDFVCLEHALIVELDGGQHVDRTVYDLRRTKHLELQGFKVLRFWNSDVLQDTEAVLTAIRNALTPALSQREREMKP